MIEVAEAIRRYDDVVVEKLCAHIVSPDADPEDAIILDLIIFHSLTNDLTEKTDELADLPADSRPVHSFLHSSFRQRDQVGQ
jgi:hypothetical protein